MIDRSIWGEAFYNHNDVPMAQFAKLISLKLDRRNGIRIDCVAVTKCQVITASVV